jgi:succinate dehydrogenase / fumarate reductase cytochrome b subunit
VHVIQLHGVLGAPFKEIGGAQFDPHHASSTVAVALQPLWIKVFYTVGLLATVYHFANGLWTQGITWGLWTSAAAQRRASWVSVIVGVFLAAVGLTALFGMWGVNVDQARAVEDAMQQQRAAVESLAHPPSQGEPSTAD